MLDNTFYLELIDVHNLDNDTVVCVFSCDYEDLIVVVFKDSENYYIGNTSYQNPNILCYQRKNINVYRAIDDDQDSIVVEKDHKIVKFKLPDYQSKEFEQFRDIYTKKYRNLVKKFFEHFVEQTNFTHDEFDFTFRDK